MTAIDLDELRSLARPLAATGTVELFHHTSTEAFESIERDGAIRPWRHQINRAQMRRYAKTADKARRALVKPAVEWVRWIAPYPLVWLTTRASSRGVYMSARGIDMSAEPDVRITVRVPAAEVHPWLVWSADHDMPPHLRGLGIGELESERDYYVVERAIGREEWVEVLWE